jgi:hypothetical protein
VTNQDLAVDDPDVLQMIGDVSPKEEHDSVKLLDLNTIDLTPIKPRKPSPGKRKVTRHVPAKRGRGRPSATVTSASNSSTDHPYTSNNYDSSTSTLSADELKDMKYRRMRDLNNEASKRCRQNRKRKFDLILQEEEELRKKNAELRKRCQHMEDLVGQLKKQFIEKITNPALKKRKAIDLDKFVLDKLGSL